MHKITVGNYETGCIKMGSDPLPNKGGGDENQSGSLYTKMNLHLLMVAAYVTFMKFNLEMEKRFLTAFPSLAPTQGSTSQGNTLYKYILYIKSPYFPLVGGGNLKRKRKEIP